VSMLDGSPYQGYLYAYPHKTAYRPLRPRPALADVWAAEPKGALFAYLHVPFCEMRCGFCNLFTRANPPAVQVRRYLTQLAHEAAAVRAALGEVTYALGAIGGGTPTYLTADELRELFAIAGSIGAAGLPWSVETSPATATPDRLAVLAEHGTHRVSIGVQSFLDREAHAAGRPQRRSEVERALAAIRDRDFPVLNLDLIYGIAGQTPQTWAQSLTEALRWRPEELYLYPLYVRPLTGLGRRSTVDPLDNRLALYRQGRDALLAAGYTQLSMRQFRLAAAPPAASAPPPAVSAAPPAVSAAPPAAYDCQEDGMVGLGCGARSYTRELHYSFDYAVSVGGVRAVLDDYLGRPPGDFAHAEVGFALDEAEQRLRWLVKGLLRAEGLDRVAWQARFGDDLPALADLDERGWLAGPGRLSAEGLANSDLIGPWLVSDQVRDRMGEYAPR
jgi:coproporphyrinogen III oxidase-like Fe-S oxidoreductase